MADNKLEKTLKELQSQHLWRCAYEMSEAFGHGDSATSGLNWTRLVMASYHAGAAKAIQDALMRQ